MRSSEEVRLAWFGWLVLIVLSLLVSAIFFHRPMPIDRYYTIRQMAEAEMVSAEAGRSEK